MIPDEALALEKAEQLARGAALKWASGVFCRPDQLPLLAQYRRREAQRNNSIQARLKSALQSYLEGVGIGLAQLHVAVSDVHNIQQALREVQHIWREGDCPFGMLQPIRQLVMEHVQLSVVIHSLPYIYAVPKLIAQTRDLIEKQHLLEAHVALRDLESLRDGILYRLQKAGPLPGPTAVQPDAEGTDLVQQFFAGVQGVSEELSAVLSSLAQSALAVARSDPSLLVSAIRIVEREEFLDAEETRGPMQQLWRPPGRPKNLRTVFFNALEKGVWERVMAPELLWEDLGAADLAKHLKDLQDGVVEELQSAFSVLVPCVPPHYDLPRGLAFMCHHGIARHLREILNRDLPHSALYHVLHWVTTVYPSAEMMGHPNFSSEIDVSELGPPVPPELLEEQLIRYTRATILHLQTDESGTPVGRRAAPCLKTSLDKTQKKACHLLLDELQTELQPLFKDIPSRPWLSGSNNVRFICEKMEDFSQYLCKARAPVCQFLLTQAERMVTIEYVRSLMHSKFVCRSPGERQQFAHRMALDAEELSTTLRSMGTEASTLCVPLIHSLQELFALRDPLLLSLEVSGVMAAFPDISEDHVLALLELRGDVTRDLRHTVVTTMHRQPVTLPEDYRPIFISIPVPVRAPPFCLHPSSCA
ncbi:exocyst complex component 3-like protein isoform 2-T2 [Anomaloglossus baeobatrachus]